MLSWEWKKLYNLVPGKAQSSFLRNRDVTGIQKYFHVASFPVNFQESDLNIYERFWTDCMNG